MPDRSERLLAFASRSLNAAEHNYTQIDRETLSLVWGVKKFNQYLYGRHFTLITDHRPLVSIFNPQKGIPTMACVRLLGLCSWVHTPTPLSSKGQSYMEMQMDFHVFHTCNPPKKWLIQLLCFMLHKWNPYLSQVLRWKEKRAKTQSCQTILLWMVGRPVVTLSSLRTPPAKTNYPFAKDVSCGELVSSCHPNYVQRYWTHCTMDIWVLRWKVLLEAMFGGQALIVKWRIWLNPALFASRRCASLKQHLYTRGSGHPLHGNAFI